MLAGGKYHFAAGRCKDNLTYLRSLMISENLKDGVTYSWTSE